MGVRARPARLGCVALPRPLSHRQPSSLCRYWTSSDACCRPATDKSSIVFTKRTFIGAPPLTPSAAAAASSCAGATRPTDPCLPPPHRRVHEVSPIESPSPLKGSVLISSPFHDVRRSVNVEVGLNARLGSFRALALVLTLSPAVKPFERPSRSAPTSPRSTRSPVSVSTSFEDKRPGADYGGPSFQSTQPSARFRPPRPRPPPPLPLPRRLLPLLPHPLLPLPVRCPVVSTCLACLQRPDLRACPPVRHAAAAQPAEAAVEAPWGANAMRPSRKVRDPPGGKQSIRFGDYGASPPTLLVLLLLRAGECPGSQACRRTADDSLCVCLAPVLQRSPPSSLLPATLSL